LNGLWERVLDPPERSVNLAVARGLLAATALWMVLSRPDLPSMLELPAAMWSRVSFERRVRFGLVLGSPAETALWGLLHLTLLGALLGVRPRLSCFLSGLLLYHFAPLETLIRTPNPYLRGLTLPTLGLLALACAVPGKGPDDRVPGWPLRLVQVFLCQMYFFAAWSKLFWTGLEWMEARNIRLYLLLLNQGLHPDPAASPGYAVAAHPFLCGVLGVGGVLFELAFPLVLVSARARALLVPVAILFHVANSVLFRIFFQDVALLLVFVPWDRMLRVMRR